MSRLVLHVSNTIDFGGFRFFNTCPSSSSSSSSPPSSKLLPASEEISSTKGVTVSIVPTQTSIKPHHFSDVSKTETNVSEYDSIPASVQSVVTSSSKNEVKSISSSSLTTQSVMSSKTVDIEKEGVAAKPIYTTSSIAATTIAYSSMNKMSIVSVEKKKETLASSMLSFKEKAIKQKITIDGVVYVVASEDGTAETPTSTEKTQTVLNPTFILTSSETMKSQISSVTSSNTVTSQSQLTFEKGTISLVSSIAENDHKSMDTSINTVQDNSEADSTQISESQSKITIDSSILKSPSSSVTTSNTVTKIAKTVVEEIIENEVNTTQKEHNTKSQSVSPEKVSLITPIIPDTIIEITSVVDINELSLNDVTTTPETENTISTVELDKSSRIVTTDMTVTSSVGTNESSIGHDEL